MPGRALEISLATGDIRRSFEFWTQLGFGSALTADTITHPYGVMTASHLNLGLHATTMDWPQLVLTRPDITGLVPLLEERGVEPENLRLGSEVFNELQFVDPAGMRVRVVEARTFSPPRETGPSLLGRFDSVSWPTTDAEGVAAFWERLHVDCDATPDWNGLRADIGGHSVAWHSPRVCPEPLLAFRHGDLDALRRHLTDLGTPAQSRGIGLQAPHLAFTTPEGLKVAVLATRLA